MIEAFRAKGICVEVQRLKRGDYLIEGSLVVERKTVSDFVLSMVDGRLFRQANSLRYGGEKAALIIEGTSWKLKGNGTSRESIQGALITLSLIYGIPVLRSVSPEETARLIIYCHEQLVRDRTGAIHRPGYRPKGKRRRQLYILQSLPGVGAQRAEQLLDHFGTIESIVGADAEELLEVQGIGARTAVDIHNMVREEREAYCI